MQTKMLKAEGHESFMKLLIQLFDLNFKYFYCFCIRYLFQWGDYSICSPLGGQKNVPWHLYDIFLSPSCIALLLYFL